MVIAPYYATSLSLTILAQYSKPCDLLRNLSFSTSESTHRITSASIDMVILCFTLGRTTW